MNILCKITIVTSLVLLAPSVLACSFRTGYEIAEPRPDWVAPKGPVPSAPNVQIDSLERGHGNSNPGSCADAGILILKVEVDPNIAGFAFNIVKGTFPDQVFPDYYVTPVQMESWMGFMFVWLDLPQGASSVETIDAQIEVTQITNLGQESLPTTIEVHSTGG